MTIPAYAAKRDESEPEVVAAFEAEGCAVQKLSAKGVPDLLVWFPQAETFELVEVKTGKAGLTPEQARWWHDWETKGGRRPHIVRNAAQARKLVRMLTPSEPHPWDTPASSLGGEEQNG